MKTFFQLREEKTQLTVGDYTTKHFDMCPSAVKLYSNIKNMTPMVHLVVENMMLHDLFFRLEKQAVAQGSIDMDDLEKADEYAEMIMDNARQMGLEKEHSYIEDVHMAKFDQLAGVTGEEDDSEEDMNEKTLTPAELKKREEVAKAIKRENPNMPMAKKMAIATATAKKVAEEVKLDELKKSTLASYTQKAAGSLAGNAAAAGYAGGQGQKAHPDIQRFMKNRMKGIQRSANKLAKEETELDEVSSTTIMNYSIKAAQQGMKRVAGQKTADEKMRKKDGYSSTAKVAAGPARTRKESVELEEGISNLSHSRLKFHATKGIPHGSYSNKEIKDEHNRRMRAEPDYVKAKASLGE